MKTPSVGPGHEAVDVCVIGLGVSTLALVRSLEKSGHSFVVVSETDFGVWAALHARGDDFDLLSSTALAAFSWWDFDEGFDFFSASDYYARLEADLSPAIRSRTIRDQAVGFEELDDGTHVVRLRGSDTPIRCRHLVLNVTQQLDYGVICDDLQRSLEIRDKTVFIEGYGDTTNMLMARLMLGNNHVIFSTGHFQNLDKVFRTGAGPASNAPLDIYEPYQYLTPNNHERSTQSHLCTAVAPYAEGRLGQAWRRATGIDELLDVEDFFESQRPSTVASFWRREGCNAGFGLPVKYWPVDSYFHFFDSEYREGMLEQRMLLNDTYFFMLMGRVRVAHTSRIEWLDEHHLSLGDETIEVHERMHSGMGVPGPVEIDTSTGQTYRYDYRDNLHGLWSAERPQVYFLGGERPTTGAFASTAEIQCAFIFRLIDDPSFRQRMEGDYTRLHQSWVYNYLESGQGFEGLDHTQFTGVTNHELAKLMGVERRFWPSVFKGQLAEYIAGPCIPARYPELTGVGPKYSRYCELWTNEFAPNLIAKTIWLPLMAINLGLLALSLGAPWLVGVALLLLLPAGQKLIKCLVHDVLSYGEDKGLFEHFSITAAALIAFNTYMLSFAPSWSLDGLGWHVLRTGLPMLVAVAAVDIRRTFTGTRLLFNDIRGKDAYFERWDEYLAAFRSTDWYTKITSPSPEE